jgi:hypothetical protein
MRHGSGYTRGRIQSSAPKSPTHSAYFLHRRSFSAPLSSATTALEQRCATMALEPKVGAAALEPRSAAAARHDAQGLLRWCEHPQARRRRGRLMAQRRRCGRGLFPAPRPCAAAAQKAGPSAWSSAGTTTDMIRRGGSWTFVGAVWPAAPTKAWLQNHRFVGVVLRPSSRPYKSIYRDG